MHPQVFTLVHSRDVITFIHGLTHGATDTDTMYTHTHTEALMQTHTQSDEIKLTRNRSHNFT